MGVVVAEGEAEDMRAAVRRRNGIAAALTGGVAAVALLAGWIERRPIAENFVDSRLAGAGVQGDYRITAIGPFVERLEAVRLGDPAAPDLVARSVELELGYGVSGPYLKAVRADGVRIAARVVDGRLSLGAVDRLLPKPSGKVPLKLPDLDLTLSDSRVRIETPAGTAQSRIDGEGNLADGFDGRLSLAAPRLTIKGCTAQGLTGKLRIAVHEGRPHLTGPLDLAGLACASGGVAVGPGRATLDVRIGQTLDRGRGGVALAGFGGRIANGRFASVSGLVTAAGDARQLLGTVGVNVAAPSVPSGQVAKGMIGGAFRIVPAARAMSFAGDVALRGTTIDAGQRRRIVAPAEALASTPVGPIARRAADATGRLLGNADADARLSFTLGGATGSSVDVQRLAVTGRDGGFVRLEAAGGLGWRARGKALRLDGRLTSGGGDLPAFDVRLTQAKAGDPVAGAVQLAPYPAAGARLALPVLQFAMENRQARFAGALVIDGPVGSGRVEGLTLPLIGRIDRRGGFVLGEACTPVAFRSLGAGGMALRPARITLCGQGGAPLVSVARGGSVRFGAVASAIHLTGRSGDAPLLIGADRMELSSQGVVAPPARARGSARAEALTRLDVESIEGRIRGRRPGRPLYGRHGADRPRPAAAVRARRPMALADGVLEVKGGIRVADADPTPRFAPLVARDVDAACRGRPDHRHRDAARAQGRCRDR